MHRLRTFPGRPAALLTLALLLAACGNKTDAPAPSAAAPAASAASGAATPAAAASGPPVTVTTVRAEQRDMPVLITATGSVAPLSSVDVRAQMTGVVQKVHVKEGQFVQAGALLFTLDARSAEADLAKVRAQLARDEASLADAQRQLARSRELLAQNFISQGAVDTAMTQVQAQQAAVQADRASVDASRVVLGYARVTAPGAGRLGAINAYPGTAVQANVTPLVTLTQLDPIAVSFALPQRYLPDALAALKNGGAAVSAQLTDSRQPQQGRLQFVDSAVDPATGTVKVKALFGNADARLWPGAFVNVAMTARTLAGAVVVPQAAVIQGARGTVVYVVQEGKAQLRPVKVEYAQGDEAAVSGVKPGERIVLDGRQNLRPGASVVERAREPGRGASGAASAAGGASAASGASGGSGASGAMAAAGGASRGLQP